MIIIYLISHKSLLKILGLIWYPVEDSNPYDKVRSIASYPLE